jgi:lipopolysaccharide transport system ATP-binding protein
MTDTAIRVENLGKKYILTHQRNEPYTTLRDVITEKVTAFGKSVFRTFNTGHALSLHSSQEEFWALKNVSFEIKQGESVGIIGRNGAGKSTLLKVISRITEPASGRVSINGRVASLLEVGTGFHPELTGRENIFLNGAILGMTRTEIMKKFDEIVAFSEIEKFLDTPVKRYSSGMYVRLAFAVAAHLEPEILLIDEVLAVGDAVFQKKCLGKMGAVAKEGRTVLFVSHNMTAVQNLCNRVIWLNQGQIQDMGPVNTIVGEYMSSAIDSMTERQWDDPEKAPGNDEMRIRRIYVRALSDNKETPLAVDTEVEAGVEFWSLRPDQDLAITLLFITSEGGIAFSTSSIHNLSLLGKHLNQGLYRSHCQIPANFLNNNVYHIKLLAVKNQNNVVFMMEDALVFEVQEAADRHGAYYGKRPGVVAPMLAWELSRIEGDDL